MDFHLLHILEIQHRDVDGTVLYEAKNIPNVFHRDGQRFMLSVAFNTASGITVPANYYLGLDNRLVLTDVDTMSSLSGEPSGVGYARQAVSSLNGFAVSLGPTNKYRAVTNTVSFTAVGGAWGPVRNLFLTTSAGGGGFLISSAPLAGPRTVTAGQSVTMRLATALGNC